MIIPLLFLFWLSTWLSNMRALSFSLVGPRANRVLSHFVLALRHPLKVSSQTVAACVPLQLLHCGAYFGPMLYVCSSTYDRNFWDRRHSIHYIGGREEELGWPSADRKGGREEELGWPKVSSLSWPSADQEGECATARILGTPCLACNHLFTGVVVRSRVKGTAGDPMWCLCVQLPVPSPGNTVSFHSHLA